MRLSPEQTAACLALAGESPAPASRTKYGSLATEIDGLRFDSRKEARRWQELVVLAAAGKITGLRRQVKFDLTVNGQTVCSYVADAVYEIDGRTVVEDVKSPATRKNRTYRIKRKLMRAIHNIEIHEV